MNKHLKSKEEILSKLAKMDFGKFLFLYMLGRNIDYFIFKIILDR